MVVNLLLEATEAINNAKILTLTCSKCLRVAQFRGLTRILATDKAVVKGWKSRNDKEICPKCP